MVFLHLTSCEAGALYPLCEGEKAGGCNSPKLTQGSLLPGGKEAGWPRLLLLTLAGQQAPDSCAVWNTQVLKAGGKILLLSWWAAACPFREPGSVQVVTKGAQLHREELQGCLLRKCTRSILCRKRAETHFWKGQRKFLECHFYMITLRFLPVIAVANNRKTLLSIVLLPYCCLNCCISRFNCKDAPDREVTVGFHTTLGDCERFWSQKTNWAQKCAPLQIRRFLAFLEIEGHGEIAKLKSILFAVKILPVLKGHCNCINFRDFIKGFIFLIMKNSMGEKVYFMEPPP